jgi:hypothetical protein
VPGLLDGLLGLLDVYILALVDVMRKRAMRNGFGFVYGDGCVRRHSRADESGDAVARYARLGVVCGGRCTLRVSRAVSRRGSGRRRRNASCRLLCWCLI